MDCPGCRREIIIDVSLFEAVFCPYCGEEIASSDPKQLSNCSSCSLKLPAGVAFCPRCGIKMSAPGDINAVHEQSKQHTPILEDIAEIVTEEAPELSVEPVSTKDFKAVPAGDNLWSRIADWIKKALEPLTDFFSGQWRLRRLYRKWAKDGVFSQDVIPTTESLKQIKNETVGNAERPSRLALLLFAMLTMVAFFVVIGITLTRCQ
jgi:hypothetical protein